MSGRGVFNNGLSILILAFVLAGPTFGSNSAPPDLATLEPGGIRDIALEVPVNVVFVGYEPGAGPRDIDPAAFLAGLPQASRPMNLLKAFWYGIRQEVGLEYTYTYEVHFPAAGWEDAFFGYLSSIAEPRPLTSAQQLYNAEASRSLDIPDNYWIEAPSVELYLAANPPPGVDTTEYTVFFINWYDRPDFKHHVYVKTNEPDPDTGFNFGEVLDSRKMLAWGGTAADDPQDGNGVLRRIWFYDLSAGPEVRTRNWNLADADVDGNGVPDYRMPPVWEYGNPGGYRPFDDISGDLSKVARYVAVNALFTSAPAYWPAISPPALPSGIEIDVNVFQGAPGEDGRDYLDAGFITAKLAALRPHNTFTTEVASHDLSGRALEVYQCFQADVSCFGRRLWGIAWGDLFIYFTNLLNQFLEGDADYEVPVFAYNTTADLLPPGLTLGFADDNWSDGTQSYAFAFLNSFFREFGYGFTSTIVHEVGHHVGMMHPHEGFDYEQDLPYEPFDDFLFVWAGTESNTVMSYIDLNFEFGQFDVDNMSRWLTVNYINYANRILALVYASPRAGQAAGLLLAADAAAATALASYAAGEWVDASAQAKTAYGTVLEAAALIGVKVEPQAWPADYRAKGRSSKFVDTLSGWRLEN